MDWDKRGKGARRSVINRIGKRVGYIRTYPDLGEVV
jgi:hypothetical protein